MSEFFILQLSTYFVVAKQSDVFIDITGLRIKKEKQKKVNLPGRAGILGLALFWVCIGFVWVCSHN
jgi:hypothetical protein